MTAQKDNKPEASLSRIKELVTALNRADDPSVREQARELFEEFLSLHGVCLAKMTATIAQKKSKSALLDLAADDQVQPLLLLYGLHPQDLDTRVKKAIKSLEAPFKKRGHWLQLREVTDGGAVIKLWAGKDGGDGEVLRKEVEAAIFAAAPDLDQLHIEVDAAEVAA